MARMGTMRRTTFVAAAVLALVAGGCGGEDDLPEPTGGEDPSEVVPGEEGPVD